jgi:ribonuclease R
LTHQIGNEFSGVVTGITNFGIFVQIQAYLIDGLIRYEDLMDDWWDVDEKSGQVRGQRTGQVIRIGDVVKTVIVRVDLPRRELGIAITQLPERIHKPKPGEAPPKGTARGGGAKGKSHRKGAAPVRGGGPRGGGRPQSRSVKPPMGKPKNKGPKKRRGR